MVNAALILAALAAAAPGELSGVVRVARGTVSIGGAPAEIATVIPPRVTVETGPDGYLELALGGAVRVRVSASTRMSIEPDALRLVTGRLWIQAAIPARPVILELPEARAELSSSTSAVAEHTRTAGSAIAVRAGKLSLTADQQTVNLAAQQIAVLPPGEVGTLRVRPGGEGLAELATREAEAGLGDMLGLGAFLLLQARRAELRQSGIRGVQDILRTDAEQAAADAGAGGFLVESALRPPAFFEEEVPPKGPNVRVEVTFGDQ